LRSLSEKPSKKKQLLYDSTYMRLSKVIKFIKNTKSLGKERGGVL
jgi:hypothetical protein